MATDPADADRPGESARKTIHLASWDDRFWAWLIDVIVVGAVLSALGGAVGVFSLVTGSLSVTTPFVGVNGLGLWVYWTLLEGYRGQSAGKIVMNIAVTDERGEDVDYAAAAVESFGKAFLLPIDVLIGWLAMQGEYVRLFNRLSSTIVVEVPEDDAVPEGVEYVPPED
ncbi:MAG: RDD family protein [Haloarculaceae archaeon]